MSLNAHLNLLETTGLIAPAPTLAELEYLFRHALIQDTAYASLVRADRHRLHQEVGETLERLYADRLDELSGFLAYHFGHAGQVEKAVDYSRRAAKRAASAYAYGEAVGQLQFALNLLQSGDRPALQANVLEELADIYRLTRDGLRAIELYRAVQTVANGDQTVVTRLSRKIIQALAEVKYSVEASSFQAANQVRASVRASIEVGLKAAQNQPPDAETVRLLAALSTDSWKNENPPNWAAAVSYAQSAVDLAERLGSPVELTSSLAALGDVLDARSSLTEYLEVALRRLDIALDPDFDNVHERLDALRGAGAALMFVGQYEAALQHLGQAEALATQVMAIDQQFNALSLRAQCYFRLDRWNEVLTTEDQWRLLSRKHGRMRTGPT